MKRNWLDPKFNMCAASSRATRTLGVLLATVLMSLPGGAAASSLEYSDTSILVQSEIRVDVDSSNPAQRVPDGLILPDGTFGEFETLIEPPNQGSRFPTSPNSLPRGFISAKMNTSLNGAVGVSGTGMFGEVWNATAHFGQSVTNRSVAGNPDVTIPVSVRLTVPAGEVSYWGRPNSDPANELRNLAQIELSFVERDETGAILQAASLIRFFGFIEKSVAGVGLAGLLTNFDFPSQANARTFEIAAPGRGTATRVAGVRWDEFTQTVVLDLLPGHTFDFAYDMDAIAFTDIPNARFVLDDDVYGAQVLIGDPFNLSGSAGGSITIAQVPEPAVAALLGVGLLGLALLGRRRDSARGSRGPDWLRRTLPCALLLLSAVASTQAARASDGVIEINQTSALAGGITPADGPGFPVVLAKSGSFRLTSNLDVPGSTDGIVISTSGVTLDLNGFGLESTYQCCAAGGTGSGVTGAASRTTVVNGEVAGFAQRGLVLGSFSHVERVVVRQVGTHGIALGDGSVVLANRVTQVGESGLLFTGTLPGVYRDNVLANTALGSGSVARAVGGVAHASGGNYCEDSSCSPRGTRRYYLSQTNYLGDEVLSACVGGFHFASMHELRDPSALEYDGLRGMTLADSSVPGGPPSGSAFTRGWIRTGFLVAPAGTPGEANCSNWSAPAAAFFGTQAEFNTSWSTDPDAYARWATATYDCADPAPVWCIED